MTNIVGLEEVKVAKTRAINLIVVHCSATQPDPKIDVRTIDRMHRQRGFKMIGYHYLIKTDGTIQIGRNIESNGAHVSDYNTGSIGICMIGGIDKSGKPSNNFSEEQFNSLRALLDKLYELYGDKVRTVGHRDLSRDLNGDGKISIFEHIKACPCFDVGAWLASDGREFGSVL